MEALNDNGEILIDGGWELPVYPPTVEPIYDAGVVDPVGVDAPTGFEPPPTLPTYTVEPVETYLPYSPAPEPEPIFTEPLPVISTPTFEPEPLPIQPLESFTSVEPTPILEPAVQVDTSAYWDRVQDLRRSSYYDDPAPVLDILSEEKPVLSEPTTCNCFAYPCDCDGHAAANPSPVIQLPGATEPPPVQQTATTTATPVADGETFTILGFPWYYAAAAVGGLLLLLSSTDGKR